MKKFTLHKIDEEEPDWCVGFYKLSINGKCPFDTFHLEVGNRKQYLEELNSIYLYIDYVSRGEKVPDSKFKELKRDKKDKIKDYEFRSRNLRVYVIKDSLGKVIVLGGYKSNQTSDLKRLRRIKKEYLNSGK
jgi:hypothetical protein